MEAAASIITFATVGLKSIKTIHDAISAIRDGPEKLRDLETAIGSLESILLEISHGQGPSTLPSTQRSILEPLLRRCAEDVQRFEAKIAKLGILPTDKMHGKIWKRLRQILSEKDIPHMLSVLNGHHSALAAHFSVKLADIDGRQVHMQRTIDMMATDHAKFVVSVAANHTQATAGMGRLGSALTGIDGPQTAQATDDQMKVVMSKLETLTLLAEANSARLAASAAPIDESIVAANSQVVENLQSLLKLMKRQPEILSSEDFEDYADALDSLSRVFCAEITRDLQLHSEDCAAARKMLARWLRQLSSQFISAPSVRLNMTAPRHHDADKMQRISETNTTMSLRLPEVVFTLTNQKRESTGGQGEGDSPSKKACYSIQEKMTMTFAYKSGQGEGILLKAHTIQAVTAAMNARIVLTPTISISRTVPSISRVFELVKTGDLKGFQRLLTDGTASVWDRDEKGASLLHYACNYHRRGICKYLVERGLDLDDLALTDDVCPEISENYRSETPIQCMWLERDPQPARLQKHHEGIECFDLLADAGADLTVIAGDIFMNWDLSTVRTFWRDNKSLEWDGHGVLQLAAANADTAKVKYLLERGVDANFRDSNGHTALTGCLHLQVPRYMAQLDCLKILISHGADIHAKHQGRSCTEIAYSNHEYGCHLGDVWDAALAATGHDVRELRAQYPQHPHQITCARQAYYLPGGPQHLVDSMANLWQGMKNLCPDYDEHIAAAEEWRNSRNVVRSRAVEEEEEENSENSEEEWETEDEDPEENSENLEEECETEDEEEAHS